MFNQAKGYETYMKKIIKMKDFKKNDYVGLVLMNSWEKKDA